MTILNEEVISDQGCFRHVRRWIEGWIPGLDGKFTMGFTGKETVIECYVFSTHNFEVKDKPAHESV